MNSPEKFKETCLPPTQTFCGSINNENVKEKEYKNVHAIWNKSEVKDFQAFTNLYNKVDILLLADVMENLREIPLKTYKLNPALYFTSPGFAWDCMLKLTKNLELLTEYDMILMTEKGIRGGISQCSNRHVKANNMYMQEKFDENK
jgi:hypothetical protein